MKIAVNTRFLLPERMEGYSYYIHETFTRIAASYPEHIFYFLFDRDVTDAFRFTENVQKIVVKPQARHPFLWTLWYNWQVPRILKKIGADVFVSPDGFCSTTTSVPQCLVVHDLAFLHDPSFLIGSHLRFYRKRTPVFLKKAKTIVTVSEFSKQDICRQYHINPEKITVAYNAVNPVFKPVTDEQREEIKYQYTGGMEYFLFTGTIHPRKNSIHLLKAFSLFKKKTKSGMKLVIAGRMAWKTEAFKKLLSTFKYRDDVVLTGYLSKPELAAVTAAAYAMVYPSFFEGFGVPPLEALQCGVPAIVSNTSAMPEVGGNAYLYVNPGSIEDIAEKMITIYKDEALRKQLIENGSKRLPMFSWNHTAEKIWQCILQTAEKDSCTFAQ